MGSGTEALLEAMKRSKERAEDWQFRWMEASTAGLVTAAAFAQERFRDAEKEFAVLLDRFNKSKGKAQKKQGEA